ncbi:MAG: pyridoxal-phosphate dependent enzyme, partial [Acidimicrobiales bacterium]|nr:pyridoxal-phosphate dependent enzyme [Acidimicrobiales bacterium]
TDDEILAAYRFLAAEESVFCEPASAASVAGLLRLAADGSLPRGARVACILTGHGLKDPDIAISQISVPTAVDADLGAVLAQLAL